MRLLTKGGRIIGSLPADGHEINEGQLCVKGRFCVTELVGSHDRLTKPYRFENSAKVEISWDTAVQCAAENLSACPPDKFGLLISPDASNEDLYVAQKFARVVMRSHNVDTSARLIYRSGFKAFLNLMHMAVPLSHVRRASTIMCIGLDTRFGGSVAGVAIRQAIRRGARIITIHPRDHNLALIAHKWIQPLPGGELDALDSLVRLTEKAIPKGRTAHSKRKSQGGNDDLRYLAEMLKESTDTVILVGQEFLSYRNCSRIFDAIALLARNIECGVFPVCAQSNLIGSVLMGAYPDLLPGAFPVSDAARLAELGRMWGANLTNLGNASTLEPLWHMHGMQTLYLIGVVPDQRIRPAEFTIFQNMYPPPPSYRTDLVLPAGAFSEVDGTLSNVDGGTRLIRKAVNAPGDALPDWEILCRIARTMGFKGFDFASAGEVHKEVSSLVRGPMDFRSAPQMPRSLEWADKDQASRTAPIFGESDEQFPFILISSTSEHTYRGFAVSTRVEGAGELFSDTNVDIGAEDAARAGVSEGDEVLVISPSSEMRLRARIVAKQAKGTLHISLNQGDLFGGGPHSARIVKTNV